MSLYKLFSTPMEIQYKSYFISKAMLFIIVTALLNIILPFIVAFKSRGFWLHSHSFFEQPVVHSTYDYLLLLEFDDPSFNIICSNVNKLSEEDIQGEEHCSEVQTQEWDYNSDFKNDNLEYKFKINIPAERNIVSAILLLAIDFQTITTCQIHMQSLAVISKEFTVSPNELNIYGDIQLYQVSHLPCLRNTIDTRYNISLFYNVNEKNIIDSILKKYFEREVNTVVNSLYSRISYGHTASMDINISLRVPETKILYVPSILQELKWAWPQYLSLAVIFYWILNYIRLFVFKNRLLMAWELVPVTKNKNN